LGEKDRGLGTCKPLTEQAGGLEAFLHGAAQNFEVVLNIQDQKLKIEKHIAVNVLLKGFPLIPLSCRSNLAGRYL
jgi:hypothetical protein